MDFKSLPNRELSCGQVQHSELKMRGEPSPSGHVTPETTSELDQQSDSHDQEDAWSDPGRADKMDHRRLANSVAEGANSNIRMGDPREHPNYRQMHASDVAQVSRGVPMMLSSGMRVMMHGDRMHRGQPRDYAQQIQMTPQLVHHHMRQQQMVQQQMARQQIKEMQDVQAPLSQQGSPTMTSYAEQSKRKGTWLPNSKDQQMPSETRVRLLSETAGSIECDWEQLQRALLVMYGTPTNGKNVRSASSGQKRASTGSGDNVKSCGKQQTSKSHPSDGYRWLKYGQKLLTNSQLYREYFRCAEPDCTAKKHVEVEPRTGRIVSSSSTAHNHPANTLCGDNEEHSSKKRRVSKPPNRASACASSRPQSPGGNGSSHTKGSGSGNNRKDSMRSKSRSGKTEGGSDHDNSG